MVPDMVMGALRANGHMGVVKAINAHGNLANIPLHTQQALQRKGVNLISVPVGRKEAADKAILVDMLFFAMDCIKSGESANGQLANTTICLLTGDADFSEALHRLARRTFKILLMVPQNRQVNEALTSAAVSIWDFGRVLRGAPEPIEQGCPLRKARTLAARAPVAHAARAGAGAQDERVATPKNTHAPHPNNDDGETATRRLGTEKQIEEAVNVPSWLAAEVASSVLMECRFRSDSPESTGRGDKAAKSTVNVAQLGMSLLTRLGGVRPDYATIGVPNLRGLLKHLSCLGLVELHQEEPRALHVSPGAFAPLVWLVSCWEKGPLTFCDIARGHR